LGTANVNKKKEDTVKKLWLVVVVAALAGLSSRAFADVQNIRISGDIRIRGYYIDSAGDAPEGAAPAEQDKSGASFISQRTRVSVEADLEDHVLVVVTLQAEGEWGADNGVSDAVGAGTGNGGGSAGKISRLWGVGVAEAYVQFNEVFYTPATLKLGRQYLQYGHGLILSSVEQEYNYDAARLVLDYYPLTIDVVGAEVVNDQSFGAEPNHGLVTTAGANDLLFVNARYELSDSAVKDVEAYFGWLSQSDNHLLSATEPRVPPIQTLGSSPLLIGLRTDINPLDALQTWGEAAYEFGQTGDVAGDASRLSALIANVGGRYTLKNVQWVPAFNANYIFASGGGKDDNASQFRPWFDYADGYNGYLFEPALSNIHILNLGGSVKPYENTTLSLQGYYYLKAEKGSLAGSNENVDFGGPTWANILTAAANTADTQDLGWEIDGIVGYDYSKDVRAQLVYGVFLPEGAYRHAETNLSGLGFGVSHAAEEVRAEVDVKF
jgi:hypothetical protein